ncbi:MerR family transcriptional regulator [Rhodococcus sp. SJ-2]
MQIGQVATRTELSLKTIRHYDEVGLVTPSARSSGGFRLYTEDDVQRLLVIRRMKPLGFSLEEMRELLAALDTIAGADAAPDAVAGARTVLAGFYERAEDSCARLRTQVTYAEELTSILKTHAG